MRWDHTNLPGPYKTIDDATAREIANVLWVDDTDLQYAVEGGFTINFMTGICTVDEVITTVQSVTLNHAAREIHLNTPPLVPAIVPAWPFMQKAQPCDECSNGATCRRIGMCLRFKCAFGEVAKP